ncbi:MAG TPA: response regulator [Phycisphaerae bacterium]|nr:response regulator [Phycisphaerae bacterium]
MRQINALIVDDSATTRKLVISALKQTGLAEFLFTEAADGVDAMAKFLPGKTELIFVDMNMPRMSGLEFIRSLHKRHKICPAAVVITAESDRKRLKEIENEPGVAALMLKPVDRDRLRSGLKTLVDGIPERTGPCAVPHGECVPLALEEVLARACELKLTPAPVDESVTRGEVVLGMLSVFGGVHWSVSLGFASEAACGVASRFSSSEMESVDQDVGDAIGEITNIVGSRIRLLLAARDVTVKCSLPMVINASGLQILAPHPLKTVINHSYFQSPVGRLWTAVSIGATSGIVL